MTRQSIAALSSGGKDSLFMLETLRHDPARQVEALVTTVNETNGRVAMHGTPESLLRAQADSLGVELVVVGLPEGCDNETYLQRLAQGMAPLRDAGIETVACGDLFLADIRRWRESTFEGLGWRSIFPIWYTPTQDLADKLAAEDFDIIVTCVDTERLPESLLGRRFDRAFLDDLPDGVDPCGENGEFHSFVCNGPGFEVPIEVATGRRVRVHDRFLMVDLLAID